MRTVRRWVIGALLVAVARIVIQSLPDIARYRKMRAM